MLSNHKNEWPTPTVRRDIEEEARHHRMRDGARTWVTNEKKRMLEVAVSI